MNRVCRMEIPIPWKGNPNSMEGKSQFHGGEIPIPILDFDL